MPSLYYHQHKIFYRIEGHGETILLLHGFGEDGNIWNEQIEVLKGKYRLIIPDIPGSGQSEMIETARSMDDYAAVLKSIADKEIIINEKSTFSLIGHSMGGYIALAFAEKYPSLLNSLVLFHSSAFADDVAKIETRKKGIEFIKNHGAAAFIQASAPNLFSPDSKESKPDIIEKLINLGVNSKPEALIQYYEAMIARPDRTEVLQSFRQPIMFIIGKHDVAVPMSASLKQCHIPAISSVCILQQSGHVGMWEEGATSSKHLIHFLQNLV